MGMSGAFWTEVKVNELRSLVDQGIPFSEIGAKLGCSRNAAIGKALREKIRAKFSPGAGRRPAKDKSAQTAPARQRGKVTVATVDIKPVEPESPPPPVERPYQAVRALPSGRSRVMLPPSLNHDDNFDLHIESIVSRTPRLNIHLIPSDKQCKWITGDTRSPDAYWCRMVVRAGTHYCETHAQIMYVPPKERSPRKVRKTYR